jgi:phosphatidylglycerophosphate synthase
MLWEKRHSANLITAGRALFLPLFLLATLANQAEWLVGFFVAHSAVDALDGWVARHWGIESDVGRQLDSLIDVLVWLPGVACFAWFVRAEMQMAFRSYPHLFIAPVVTALLMNGTAYHYLGRLAAIHLYSAKLTAALIMLLLLMMLWDGFKPWLGYITALSAMSYHLEAIAIYALQQGHTDENVTSLWQVIQAQSARF